MDAVFRLKIGGSAGQGIKSAGLIFSKFMSRSGFYVYNYTEYPSLIKGGHNMMQINTSSQPIHGSGKETDILIALNQDTVFKHKDSLKKGAMIIADEKSHLILNNLSPDLKVAQVPLSKLAQESGGNDLYSNSVSLGFLVAICNLDLSIIKQLVKEEYGDGEIERNNEKALDLGYEFAQQNFNSEIGKHFPLTKSSHEPLLVLNGDEACAIGAIKAGMQFAAIYPMTPISNLMQALIKFQKEYQFIFKQPEDEISAINMAIGASFAGVRSMTATSGGGFCLMSEGYGLAAMTETPLVIIEGMRGGPATGLPTWNSQGDLRFLLHAHQDEFPRVVLAAGDVSEALTMTMEAFHLADKLQTPIILILDKNICEHEQSIPVFSFLVDEKVSQIDRGKFDTLKQEKFQRYQIFPDGISPRTIPGSGNFLIANSDEHDEIGFSSETSENRVKQMNKRMTKHKLAEKLMPEPEIIGPKNAELTIVSWGSNKGPIMEVLKSQERVNFLHLTWMNPFPSKKVQEILTSSKQILLIESNYSGQLGGLIREKTGIEIKDALLKFDGRPFFVEELETEISKRLNSGEKK